MGIKEGSGVSMISEERGIMFEIWPWKWNYMGRRKRGRPKIRRRERRRKLLSSNCPQVLDYRDFCNLKYVVFLQLGIKLIDCVLMKRKHSFLIS